jgi:hypothetical protein
MLCSSRTNGYIAKRMEGVFGKYVLGVLPVTHDMPRRVNGVATRKRCCRMPSRCFRTYRRALSLAH